MASATKKVTLDVAVKTQESQIDALEKELDDAKKKASELNRQKIQMKVEADTQALNDVTQKLNQAESKLDQMKSNKLFFATDTDAPQKLQQAQAEVDRLKQQQINLQLQVEDYKLDELQSKKDAIEADEINVQLNNQSAMQGLEQIADGFSRIKSAASEVGQQFGELLSSAGKQETNFKFLENAVGNAELARQKMSEINQIVAQLPGDDTALQGLLSSAAAKDSSLTADNLRSMANSATDYFSAMSYYGKSATEAQQDMTNYLLAGNTAELERSPILQGHIDKLKEATTVQERSKALAEALNEEHWGGMGAMDTYNNKLETFNGMIERGRYTLGGMFQEGAKAGMDFLLKLDESTNGLVGMTIAASSFASPVTDALIGLGQIATGINAIKETKIAEWASNAKDKLSSIGSTIRNIDFASKFNALKTGLIDIATRARTAASSLGSTLWTSIKSVGSAAKTAAVEMGKFTVKIIKAGAEAVISAGKWLIAKGALVAERIATMAAAGAQAFLNFVMSMNPIMLVVIAITALIAILGYLYFTNEDVRNAINGLGESLIGLGETIYGSLQGTLEWLQGAWQNTVDWFNNGAQSISDNVTNAFTWLSDSVTGTFGWLVDNVTGAWQGLMDWLTSGAQWISDSLTNAFTWLYDIWNNVVNAFNTYAPLVAQVLFVMATGGVGAIILLIGQFMGMPTQVGAALQNVITRVTGFVSNLVNNFVNGARNAVNNFMNQIRSLPGQFVAELNRMLSAVDRWAATLPQKFWQAGVNAVKNFLNALGIHSPGFMAVNFSQELQRMEDSATHNNIASQLGRTAKDMLNKWGTPNLMYNIELDKVKTNNADSTVDTNSIIDLLTKILDKLSLTMGKEDNVTYTQQDTNSNNVSRVEELLSSILAAIINNANGNITFNHYGDTDDEEKLQRILDFIVREINWNNETAGRDTSKYGV